MRDRGAASEPKGGGAIARTNRKGGARTLDRARVARAAVELADAEGIESVTMRRLGRLLGVEAASLYNHVAGKDDLLDAMADLAAAEIHLPPDEADWKEAMRRRAVSAREVFARHRWAARLIASRRGGGPGGLSYADRVLGTLLEAGFPPRTAANAFLALDSYINGFEQERANLSVDDDVDSTVTARETLSALPEGAYPSLARVAREYAETPYDDDAAFDFGLGLILEGLERLLERGGAGPTP